MKNSISFRICFPIFSWIWYLYTFYQGLIRSCLFLGFSVAYAFFMAWIISTFLFFFVCVFIFFSLFLLSICNFCLFAILVRSVQLLVWPVSSAVLPVVFVFRRFKNVTESSIVRIGKTNLIVLHLPRQVFFIFPILCYFCLLFVICSSIWMSSMEINGI